MGTTPSFRLLDLLQCRRRLPPQAVVQLLQSLPALIESPAHFTDEGKGLLGRIAVHFSDLGTFASPRAIMLRDPADWPAFRLELAPEKMPEQDDEETIVPAFARTAEARVGALSNLLLELLGGARRNATGSAIFTPISSISAEANDLLRAGFEERAGTDCRAFWETWLRACGFAPGPLPDRSVRPAPGSAARSAKAIGTVLDLQPADTAHPQLRLSARPEFRIGRSGVLADFSLHRDLPRGDEISRVHVFAESGASGLTLRDGDGAKASGNGSSFDGQPLDALKATPLNRRGRLLLAGFYALEMVPVMRGSLISAVYLVPPAHDLVLRNAAWIFSAIPFRLRDGQITWEDAGLVTGGFISYQDRGFSICHGDVCEVAVNEVDVPAGETATLLDGGTLLVDGHRFRVSLR